MSSDTKPTKNIIPYGRQQITEDDIAAVGAALRSDWLTTGPLVPQFERRVAEYVGARHGIAVSSGTAALHSAMFAIDICPGDEVIVPPMTFAATANCVAYMGGTPVFCDVEPDTLLLNPNKIEEKITQRTKAVIAVDYAGQPCDYDRLKAICHRHNLSLVADACHAIGATYKDRKVGALADMTVFSFHPVKHITTGEGGMVMTDNDEFDMRIRRFRNHGITKGFKERAATGEWHYEMTDLGFNYRISDFQCALGISQLSRLPEFLAKRRKIAEKYTSAFSSISCLGLLTVRPEVQHALHLYTILYHPQNSKNNRDTVFSLLRKEGIGVNVHYIPVHLHPYYKQRFNTGPGLCPIAENAYEKILTLPLFPSMSDEDVDRVINAVLEVTKKAEPGSEST